MDSMVTASYSLLLLISLMPFTFPSKWENKTQLRIFVAPVGLHLLSSHLAVLTGKALRDQATGQLS